MTLSFIYFLFRVDMCWIWTFALQYLITSQFCNSDTFGFLQITYWTRSVTSGYKILINDKEFVRCVTAQKTSDTNRNLRTQCPTPCSITAATYLKVNDQISFEVLYTGRHILHHKPFSFWGLVRIPAGRNSS